MNLNQSLSLDGIAYAAMSVKRRQWYEEDLAIRRRIAHNRDFRQMQSNWKVVARDVISHIVPSAEWIEARKQVEGLDANEAIQAMDRIFEHAKRLQGAK
jgi:hypothetical protein